MSSLTSGARSQRTRSSSRRNRRLGLRILLGFSLAAAAAAPAAALQCVPFARAASGIDIHGNALTWWSQAADRYRRGGEPEVGAVLAFKPTRAMPVGHVAVVAAIVDDRHILLDHANWSVRGGIERGVLAEDASENGDWSVVRVWYGPQRSLGRRVNPTFGFIYNQAPADAQAPMVIASNAPAARAASLAQIVEAALPPVTAGTD